MFGHVDATKQMKTDQSFYLTLPDDIRKGKGSKQSKKKIAFQMILEPNNKRTCIDIKMRKLKFYVRPHVFAEISDFFIHCLQKLDLKKDKEAKALEKAMKSR